MIHSLDTATKEWELTEVSGDGRSRETKNIRCNKTLECGWRLCLAEQIDHTYNRTLDLTFVVQFVTANLYLLVCKFQIHAKDGTKIRCIT